jgi:hypothetical protein
MQAARLWLLVSNCRSSVVALVLWLGTVPLVSACGVTGMTLTPLSGGQYRLECASSLRTCLLEAEKRCGRAGYQVGAARETRKYAGPQPFEKESLTSQATFWCGTERALVEPAAQLNSEAEKDAPREPAPAEAPPPAAPPEKEPAPTPAAPRQEVPSEPTPSAPPDAPSPGPDAPNEEVPSLGTPGQSGEEPTKPDGAS